MTTEQDFIFDVSKVTLPETGQFTWRTPSNIALVKYWGKTEPQLPKNASVSFTLDACYTQTTLEFKMKNRHSELDSESHNNEMLKQVQHDRNFTFEIYFEGQKKDSFKPKIKKFFERIVRYVPFIAEFDFVIKTRNSFPHSSGIASSASGMAAMALCIMSMEKALNPEVSNEFFLKKASFLARLGSGSATRSIEGPLVVWGAHPQLKGSSDLYGVNFPYTVHENFKNFHDTILLVDKGEKQVSSTVGHNLMHQHPFAEARFKQAFENLTALSNVLQNGDLKKFIKIVESEALTLHAMMLTSDPYFILMKPNTLEIIIKIWEFRAKTGTHICFTLDAGANVHVLYPEKEKEICNSFVVDKLIQYCQNEQYICDRAGYGARQF